MKVWKWHTFFGSQPRVPPDEDRERPIRLLSRLHELPPPQASVGRLVILFDLSKCEELMHGCRAGRGWLISAQPHHCPCSLTFLGSVRATASPESEKRKLSQRQTPGVDFVSSGTISSSLNTGKLLSRSQLLVPSFPFPSALPAAALSARHCTGCNGFGTRGGIMMWFMLC